MAGAPVQGLLDRRACEMEPDPRAVGPRALPAGVIVDLHDDVGAAGEEAADALGESARLVPGRPARPGSPWISIPGPEKHE